MRAVRATAVPAVPAGGSARGSDRLAITAPFPPYGDRCGDPSRAPVESLHMKADALRGHLDALLLAVLDDEPRHGYAIIEALQERSGGVLALPTGTVYPALRRMERAGLVESAWSTGGGRDRRTYQLP